MNPEIILKFLVLTFCTSHDRHKTIFARCIKHDALEVYDGLGSIRHLKRRVFEYSLCTWNF